jgi:hypothetical protein
MTPRVMVTKWLRLRAVFAVGVLALLVVELTTGGRNWPIVVPQAVLIVGIVITSVLDLNTIRARRHGSAGPPSDRL